MRHEGLRDGGGGGCQGACVEDVGWDWAVENEKHFLSTRRKKRGYPSCEGGRSAAQPDDGPDTGQRPCS